MEFLGIDAAALATPGTDAFRSTVEQLRRVTRTSGAFGVLNHGIPSDVFARAFEAQRAWFELPDAVKRAQTARPPATICGYHPQPAIGDVREKFLHCVQHGAPAEPPFDPSAWPVGVPGIEADSAALVEAARRLGLDLLRGITASLGVEESELLPAFREGGTAYWMLHYPPVAPGTGARDQGTSAHTDFLPMTLILQDPVGGLEVRDATGEWAKVDPVKWPVVCQMGDMIGRWSNDTVRPNVHRVRSDASRQRYSFVISLFPRFDAIVSPLRTCVDADRPRRYPDATFGECIRAWLRSLDDGTGGSVPDQPERHPTLTV